MPRLVLLYHKIIAGSSAIDDPCRISVSERNFADQIGVLRRRARVISLGEWLSVPPGEERTTLVTFDDGYRASLRIAQTILGEAGAKAVAFLCPGHLGMTTLFWWDRLSLHFGAAGTPSREKIMRASEELMHLSYEDADATSRLLCGTKDEGETVPEDAIVSNWDDVRGLDPAIFDIAHHGFQHDCFSALSTSRLNQQFSRATQYFHSHDVPVHRVLAYPFGFSGSITMDQIRECVAKHFVAAFTSSRGIEVSEQPLNRFLSPRNYVCNWSADQFDEWLMTRFAAI